jgi:hypothetical protein
MPLYFCGAMHHGGGGGSGGGCGMLTCKGNVMDISVTVFCTVRCAFDSGAKKIYNTPDILHLAELSSGYFPGV